MTATGAINADHTAKSASLTLDASSTWKVTANSTLTSLTGAVVSGSAEIDREQWGLTWNVALESGGVLVSKKIQLEIEAEIVPAPAAA